MKSSSNLKIAFFVRELSNVMGGMERQMLTIAQSLTELGHAVTVISLDEDSPQLFYSSLAKGIEFLNVPSGNPSEKQNISSRINRQSRVYQRIKEEKFDVSVAFMTGAYWYSRIPTLLCRVPLILAERNAPSIYRLTRVRKIRGILFLSMFFSAAMTIQFPRYALQYPFYLRHKIHVIPNIVEHLIQEKPKAKSKITFVFAGRFSYQKQPLLLLRAFLEFSRNRPDVELLLFGKGDLKSEMLEILSTSPNSSCVTIVNPTQSAKDFLQVADVLCIPSIWEGFPNVLAEALSSGIPALGFSNCDGVSDLIQNGVNGWTIEGDGTVEPLLNLLEISYTGIIENQISTQNCSDSVLAYEKTRVTKQWEDLLLRLAQ
jgi:glycosyltransferase involved in cell wall biosynthesis